MIPDIAIGAVGAAVIGALITLVGLIISKESKVSEFRQAWIDSLRIELSTYLANVTAVADARGIILNDTTERFERLQPYYDKLNSSYYMIAFRLNPQEETSKKIKKIMVELSIIINSTSKIDLEKFEDCRIKLINLSNELLKKEWKVVKQGERVFKATRIAIAFMLASLMVATLALAFARGRTELRSNSPGSIQPTKASTNPPERRKLSRQESTVLSAAPTPASSPTTAPNTAR